MRVLQINETINIGSIGRTTYELSKELTELGHESFIAFSRGNSNNLSTFRIGGEWEHHLHAVMSRLTGLQGYFSWRSTGQLVKYMDRISPNIVHLRNLHGNYINLPILMKYLAENDIPTVITLHDCWLFTGKCPYPISINCEKYKNGCGNCPLWKKDKLNPSWFFDTTHKCIMDKRKWFNNIPRLSVVGVSKWVTEVASQSILSSHNLVTIYNWIDLDVFKPRESKFREFYNLEDKFVLLFVASFFSEYKGYTLIRTLAEKLPTDWVIVAVGKEVKPLPNNIIHIDNTNNAIELAQYYSMADVCVNCTDYETFGKVTAESISCGTPVIVYNNTASPELVGDNCGFVIDESKGISAILEKIHIIHSIGKGHFSSYCRAFAEKMFSKKVGVQKYIDLYNQMSQH